MLTGYDAQRRELSDDRHPGRARDLDRCSGAQDRACEDTPPYLRAQDQARPQDDAAAGQPDLTADHTQERAPDGAGWTLADLAGALEQALARPADELDEDQIRSELRVVDRSMRRLDARRCRLAAALVEQERRRAADTAPQDRRRREQAERTIQRELADEFDWTVADSKRATQVGRQAAESPELGKMLDEGGLSPRHATLLAETLKWLDDEDFEHVRRKLLAVAGEQNPVQFGRTCRRLLAEADHDSAMAAESRRRQRRRAKAWQTDDGMVAFSGQLSGIAGETFWTALQAFRRPSPPDEPRTSEQVSADALVEMASAALRSEEAPTKHGLPAQIIVTVDAATVASGAGVAELPWSGPVPYGEANLLVDDSAAARLVLDARSLPAEASEAVRTVPVAVYRGIVHRDGGCIYDGCDMPPHWCQVMHLDVPYRLQGRLSFGTAALGCIHHHRRFDHGQLALSWLDGRPVLHTPDREPRPPP